VPFLAETLAAENRPALSGPERHRCFFAALRANSAGLNFRMSRARGRKSQDRHPLCLATLAALGLVPELLVVKKKLFAGGEDKICAAINALEHPVLEFH
jgi:hypothetical protein